MADDQGQLPPEHAQRIQVSAQQLAPPLGPTGGSMDGTACAYIISMQPSTCIPEAKPGTAARAGAISGAKCAPIISAPTAHETSSLACCTAGSGGGSMLFRHVVQVPVCSVSSQSVTDARNDKAGEPVMKVSREH